METRRSCECECKSHLAFWSVSYSTIPDDSSPSLLSLLVCQTCVVELPRYGRRCQLLNTGLGGLLQLTSPEVSRGTLGQDDFVLHIQITELALDIPSASEQRHALAFDCLHVARLRDAGPLQRDMVSIKVGDVLLKAEQRIVQANGARQV